MSAIATFSSTAPVAQVTTPPKPSAAQQVLETYWRDLYALGAQKVQTTGADEITIVLPDSQRQRSAMADLLINDTIDGVRMLFTTENRRPAMEIRNPERFASIYARLLHNMPSTKKVETLVRNNSDGLEAHRAVLASGWGREGRWHLDKLLTPMIGTLPILVRAGSVPR